MALIGKNTVKADNQIEKTLETAFDCEGSDGIRVLFVGNSLLHHGPNSEIGWLNDCGMAASSEENDYVHIVERLVLEKDPRATFCTCQAAKWEMNYLEGETVLPDFVRARDFEADIIIVHLLENCNFRTFNADIFTEEYIRFLTYLDKKGQARFIVTSSFWKHPGDEVLGEIAKSNAMDYIYLGDLGEDANMRADGLFEHAGVAMHPGDKGMKEIALRIFGKMDQYL